MLEIKAAWVASSEKLLQFNEGKETIYSYSFLSRVSRSILVPKSKLN